MSKKQIGIFEYEGGIDHVYNDTHWFCIEVYLGIYFVEVRKLRKKSAVCIQGTSLLVGFPIDEWKTSNILEAYVLYNKALRKYGYKKHNRQG